MNKCFYLIKRYIQIIVLLLNLISFIIINIIHSRKKSYYSEVDSTSKLKGLVREVLKTKYFKDVNMKDNGIE